jgi:16S rRNA (cytidine1402-2'-O)-methyltransferase
MAPLTPTPHAALTVPPGILYVVATPIGNLADAGPRALATLRSADIVACEDTRTTRTLLARHGIERATLALHAHNERAASAKLLEELRAGRSVALVSDAGTPGISDPGALLVEAAHREGVRVVPIPGANAAIAAFSAAGFAADRFLFVGFLPPKPVARRKALDALESACPVIFYEAPHRVRETLEDLRLRYGAEREVVIARELSKKFEEVARLPLGQARAWLDAQAHREQGEFVLVLGPAATAAPALDEGDRALDALLEVLPPSEAARLAARISGVPRNALYRRALKRGK